jgi:hypothetical protein
MEIALLLSSFFISFFIIQSAIRSGIDNSKEIKALRNELTEIKNRLKI